MINRESMQQVLGGLIKNPKLLSEVDKYNLSINDFPTKLEKYVFTAIYGLYYNGAKKITSLDIENYLKTNPAAINFFNSHNGVEYLQDIEDLTSEENFSYYYEKLKKFNLLSELAKKGFDISSIYIEDLTNERAYEVNKQFESLSTSDIIALFKKKLISLETEYASPEEVESWVASEEVDEIIASFGEIENIGLPVQGHIYSQVINGAEKGALTIRSGGSGTGKALPNSVIIPTPNGNRRVGDIKIGDYLFDAFGKPTKVLGVYPQGKKEVWEVTLKDGRTAKCCKEHLWSFNTSGQKQESIQARKFYTESLEQILNRKLQKKDGVFDILLPQQYAVEYPTQSHFIPSYVMGLMLGDGSFRQHPTNKSFQYSSENNELPSKIANIMGWNLKKNSDKNYTWYFSYKEPIPNSKKINVWVEDVLKEHIELLDTTSETKFIPEKYIYDSIENRFDLLNGLLDSDGSVDEKGRVSFWSNSRKMTIQVQKLCWSLGLKATISIDSHKESDCYVVHISGRPEDKVKLFSLKRKHERIQNWYNSNCRKEKNSNIPIVNITNLHYEEEMTCFYVDNDEHLFLTENYIVTHNTRSAVADACYLAYPIRYNIETCQWEQNGSNEKVLFIITEQKKEQILKMIIAYLTGINESKFKYGTFSEEEKIRLRRATEIMQTFDNFYIVRIPNPTIELTKTLVREQVVTHNIEYLFFDYIFINPALIAEFGGVRLRNDEILLMLATALKDLAIELNISVFTSTQVNAQADNNNTIRNESSIAGSRAIINKADNGCIMARPTKEELEILEKISQTPLIPNIVTDVYKVRSGQWTQVRIWSYFDMGIMRREDLYITDAQFNVINNFFDEPQVVIENWENNLEIMNKIEDFNND